MLREAVRKVPPAVFVSAGFTLIGLVGLLVYAAEDVFNFAVFFLLPVGLVAWFGGRPLGIVASAAAVGVWSLADHLEGHHVKTFYPETDAGHVGRNVGLT